MSFIAGTGSAVTSAAKAILSKKVLDGAALPQSNHRAAHAMHARCDDRRCLLLTA